MSTAFRRGGGSPVTGRSDSVMLATWRVAVGGFTTDAASAATTYLTALTTVGDAFHSSNGYGPETAGTQLAFPLVRGLHRRVCGVRATMRLGENQETINLGTTQTWLKWGGLVAHFELVEANSESLTSTDLAEPTMSAGKGRTLGQRFGESDTFQYVDWPIEAMSKALYLRCRSRYRYASITLPNVAGNQSLILGKAGLMEATVSALIEVPH